MMYNDFLIPLIIPSADYCPPFNIFFFTLYSFHIFIGPSATRTPRKKEISDTPQAIAHDVISEPEIQINQNSARQSARVCRIDIRTDTVRTHLLKEKGSSRRTPCDHDQRQPHANIGPAVDDGVCLLKSSASVRA